MRNLFLVFLSSLLLLFGACLDDSDSSGSGSGTDTGGESDTGQRDTGPSDVGIDVGSGDTGVQLDTGVDLGIDTGEPDQGSGTELTWNGGIDQIFSVSCAGCHSWASNYDSVTGRMSGVQSRVSVGHHISGDDKDDVLDWIEAGYPEE